VFHRGEEGRRVGAKVGEEGRVMAEVGVMVEEVGVVMEEAVGMGVVEVMGMVGGAARVEGGVVGVGETAGVEMVEEVGLVGEEREEVPAEEAREGVVMGVVAVMGREVGGVVAALLARSLPSMTPHLGSQRWTASGHTQ
jgi:hypothetical protein